MTAVPSADLHAALDAAAAADTGAAARGPFPFRLLALGYVAGLALAVGMVGAGFGALSAAAIGWFGGVAAMIGIPLVEGGVQRFLARVKAGARDEARRRVSQQARAEAQGWAEPGVDRPAAAALLVPVAAR
ncbi:hypothetical protein ACQ5SO_10635 [Rhodovulum sp. DZ06]|uniref:hypothetical protein n=1 Tax=Rhodovulum sp. DZ06 TaxID=3425126 RepID=UPI003D344828